MRKLDELNILEHCEQCIHHKKDEINSFRTYCGKLEERYERPVEICVNKHFPIVCPLPKV